MPKVCLLGAGPAGMSLLSVVKRFAAENEQKDDPIELTCYERYAYAGGIWNYNEDTGVDSKSGILHHNTIYKALFSNVPKECMEYPDFTFLEFANGKPLPSYAPRTCILDYIIARAKKYDALCNIKYNSWVENVKFDKDTQKFTVRVKDCLEGATSSAEFDYCVCATGHFNKPYVPDVPGKFTGELIHSRAIRTWERFKGKTLCVVGGSYSAEDVLMQCIKFGAKRLTSCVRDNKMDFNGWPDNVDHVKGLKSFDGDFIEFGDGTKQKYDVCVLCTGYKHDFHFIEDDLKLKTHNCLSTPLYDSVVFPNNPKMFYMGMQDQVYTFPYFECQAMYILKMICGALQTPPLDAMLEGIKAWKLKETQIANVSDFIMYQTDQMMMVGKKSKYPNYKRLNAHKLYMEWQVNKARNVMTFRDGRHSSHHTFRISDHPKEPWTSNFDDSLATFVKKVDADKEYTDSGRDFLPLPQQRNLADRVADMQTTLSRLVLSLSAEDENRRLREEVKLLKALLANKEKENAALIDRLAQTN